MNPAVVEQAGAVPTFYNNTLEYEVPVDPMDDLQCESCQ
jgi:hypothetical protein